MGSLLDDALHGLESIGVAAPARFVQLLLSHGVDPVAEVLIMAEDEMGAWYLDEEYVGRVGAEEKQLVEQLAAIRNGTLRSPGLATVLSGLGKHHFLEARPDIETFLTSENRDERCAALIALAVDFHLPEYWEAARRFLEQDSDDQCRISATTAFAALMADTHDRPTLQLLARVIRNQNENEWVRRGAYGAMLSVLGAPKREQFLTSTRRFHFPEDVKWELVDDCQMEQKEQE